MFRVICGLTFLGFIFCFSSTLAQGQPATKTPQLCNETDNMNFDASLLSGTWYEVARHPAPKGSFECVQVNFTFASDTDILNVATTYSNTPDYPWVNQTMTTNVTLDSSNTAGYNISYVNGLTNTTPAVYKLIDTDYNNYAFFCGYENPDNMNKSFGIVLTRLRTPNGTVLNSYEALASVNYADFLNGTMTLIAQPQTCYGSSATSIKPIWSSIAVVLLTIWQYFQIY